MPLGIGLLFGGLAWLGVDLTRVGNNVASIWPPNAVLLVALLRLSGRQARLTLLACATANLAVNLLYRDPLFVCLGFTVINLSEAYLGAYLVRRFCPSVLDNLTAVDYTKFVAWAALIATLPTSVAGAVLIHLAFGAPILAVLRNWWIGDAMGVFIFGTAALTWTTKNWDYIRLSRQVPNLAVSLLCCFGISALVFLVDTGYPMLFLLLPMLIVIGLRGGQMAVANGSVIIAIVSIYGALLSHGSIHLVPPDGPLNGLQYLQLVLGITIFTATLATGVFEARNAANARLEDAIQALPDGFALFDRTDRLVLCNELYAQQTNGVSRGSLIGQTASDIISRFARSELTDVRAVGRVDAWLAERWDLRRNPPPGGFPQELTDGSHLIVRERMTTEGGRVGVWTDITAEKLAERRLAETMEAMQSGVALYRADGKIVMSNTRLRQLHPLTGADLCPDGDVVNATRRAVVEREYVLAGDADSRDVDADVRSLFNDFEFSDELHTSDGRWLLMNHKPLSNGHFIRTFTDVSALKQRELSLEHANDTLGRQAEELAALAENVDVARAAAVEANRSKSFFLASMSHELRTPLNSIIGFAETINKEVFGPIEPARYKEYTEIIEASGGHLLSLINDILDLSKIEAGKFQIDPDVVDLEAIMRRSLQLVSVQVERQGLKISIECPAPCRELYADERAIKQILVNLLSNALKFTPAGGRITLTARRLDSHAMAISVADTGIGMTPAELETALKLYGQVSSKMSKGKQGTGLGLSLVQSLAELHGGRMEIDSEKDKGTVVDVILPNDPAITRAPARD